MILSQTEYAKQQCRRVFTEVMDIHDEKCLALVEENCHIEKFKRGEIFVHAGEVATVLPFILSGSAYGYFLDDKGKRVTDCIEADYGDPLTVATSLEEFRKAPDIYFEALEDLEVLCVPMDFILPMVPEYPEMQAALIRIVSKWFHRHRRMATWKDYEFPERFAAFSEEYPGLPQRLKQVSIALCLNADPATVSKYLKKIRQSS